MASIAHEELKGTAAILSGPREQRDSPQWFRDQQRTAWETFASLPAPNRKDQPWRFSSVDLLDLSPYEFGSDLSGDDRANVLKYSRGLEQCAGRIVFARDQLVSKEIITGDLKKR